MSNKEARTTNTKLNYEFTDSEFHLPELSRERSARLGGALRNLRMSSNKITDAQRAKIAEIRQSLINPENDQSILTEQLNQVQRQPIPLAA